MNELSIFNSLVNDVLGGNAPEFYTSAVSSPRVDVLENKNGYEIQMELPGRCEKDVNIELDQDKLKISSVEEKKDKAEKTEEAGKYILRERSCRKFERSFYLPKNVDLESINANFKNGVLTVSMQKKEEEMPRKIAIVA